MNKTIYTVSEAIYLQGTYDGLDGLSVYSKTFSTKNAAQKELNKIIQMAVEDEYDGNDDIDQSEIVAEILASLSAEKDHAGNPYDYCEWEAENHLCKWTIEEQKIKL